MAKVVFLHPDLGIGGAERLVVDMALALRSRDHHVTIYTTHHDPSHAFSETKDDTLHVVAKFDFLPRSILGRCFALCAFLRMIILAFYVRLFVSADVYIVDQVSACIPVLRVLSKTRVLFYCHFPDLLLTSREGVLKKLYRKPLDFLESFTTSQADKILFNSRFTEKISRSTLFINGNTDILYPSINFEKFDTGFDVVYKDIIPDEAETIFLSLNRYERKKNVKLALESFAHLKNNLQEDEFDKCMLVIAGGYDERVTENLEHYSELVDLAKELEIIERTVFLRSINDEVKLFLLNLATALLYTPSNEHFGIVPIESMYVRTPVIAVNSGGPLETVKDTFTGFLVPPHDYSFSEVMCKFVRDSRLSQILGENGRNHVVDNFSFIAFSENLNDIVTDLC